MQSENTSFKHQYHFALIWCHSPTSGRDVPSFTMFICSLSQFALGETAIQEFLQTMLHLYLVEVHRFVMQCL